MNLTLKRAEGVMSQNHDGNEPFEIRDAADLPDVPFVLDLPDGQKLLVGELAPGTVIEVASWRGTDRPDNRTLRLLLGVSEDTTAEPTETAQPAYSRGPGSDAARRAQASRRRQRAWIALLVTSVAVILGALAFYLSPLEIVHPSVGSSIGFGPANSALVVTGPPAENYNTGQLIVADTGKNSLAIGRAAAVTPDEILLQSDTGYIQVARDSVVGPSLLVIPFIGYLFPIITN